MALQLEAGADDARVMLRSYDAASGTWKMDKKSEFWNAVSLAHQQNRYGEGHTIAIVDDGFDPGIPVLAAQQWPWGPGDDIEHRSHGTAVALLVHEVAPAARLVLYPCGQVAENRVDDRVAMKAVEAIAASPAQIVNLSLGEDQPLEQLAATDQFMADRAPWPDMTLADLPFWFNECVAEAPGGWRQLLNLPERGPFDASVDALAQQGRSVFAAAGNHEDQISSLACCSDVWSTGHSVFNRTWVDGIETAEAEQPSYGGCGLADFRIPQPRNALGSSFAAPLMAGMAALMRSREDPTSYAQMQFLCSLAGPLMTLVEQEGFSDYRHISVVGSLFLSALKLDPHQHLYPGNHTVCPECSLFAASAFVNYGILNLDLERIDSAELPLQAATAFAPRSPNAACNLALVTACRAAEAKEAGDLVAAAQRLNAAADLMERASQLAPEMPFRGRIREFREAAANPQAWVLSRECPYPDEEEQCRT